MCTHGFRLLNSLRCGADRCQSSDNVCPEGACRHSCSPLSGRRRFCNYMVGGSWEDCQYAMQTARGFCACSRTAADQSMPCGALGRSHVPQVIVAQVQQRIGAALDLAGGPAGRCVLSRGHGGGGSRDALVKGSAAWAHAGAAAAEGLKFGCAPAKEKAAKAHE